MHHCVAQSRWLQHLPLNGEIQPCGPCHQAPRLAAEAIESLLQQGLQADGFLQLVGKATAQLINKIREALGAAKLHRQAGGQLTGLRQKASHHAVAVEAQPPRHGALGRWRLNAKGANVVGQFAASADHHPLGQQA